MGHYCDIEFDALLTDIGAEILSDLCKTNSMTQTARNFPFYQIFEYLDNTHKCDDRILYISREFFSKEDKKWKVKCYYKDKNQRSVVANFLPYIISERMEFSELTEWSDNKHYYRVEPKEVKIDWDRKYGDPTGCGE